MSKASSPIGVFDSGIGGLTVVRALMERLPFEDIIYFGDTARVPYGVKSRETIQTFTRQIAEYLLARDVKLLIVACNTMAAVAIDEIRALSTVPVLDVIDAGARAAVGITQRGVGVIGTPTTINSNAYARSIHSLNPDVHVHSQACPLFVPLVEEGWLDNEVARLTAREYLRPVFVEQIDTLVLGCTHYPLLKPLLKEVAGPQIRLVDSAVTVAEQTAATLDRLSLHNPQRIAPRYQYVVTDVPLRFQTIGSRFLGRELTHLEQVRW